MNVHIIKNEQHSIMDDQLKALKVKFGRDMKVIEVNAPAAGWTLEQMDSISNLKGVIVFLSPIPALMKMMVFKGQDWFVFHNDNRDKKEINGKIIMTVAKEGWVIV